jgi:glycosyltransferase involved in cell wall biosynthesis
MKFSVVIPAHNGEKYLHKTLSSVCNQTREPDEIIVLDDASTDETAQIVHSHYSSNRIKYFYNDESTGFVDAWNRSISRAEGDFVTILHQDDLLNPDYLQHISGATRRWPDVHHFYTGCKYIDAADSLIKTTLIPHSLEPVRYSGKQYACRYLEGVVRRTHIHRCPGVTTRRAILLNVCSYRKEAGHIADDDFFLRVGDFTDVVGISMPLASYREHRESTTRTLDSLSLRLAEDYVFQSKYYKERKQDLLESSDIEAIDRLTAGFITLLLFQGIQYKKAYLVAKAYALCDEFDKVRAGFLRKTLPLWAKQMWALSSPDKTSGLICYYVTTLCAIIKWRDFVKSWLRK